MSALVDPEQIEAIAERLPQPRMTERDMLDLLLDRYSYQRAGTFADRWVRAEHVRNGMGYNATRIVDFIAADKYPGVPYGSSLALHGHEVKVSRSDWLVELRDPEKSEAFKRYMHHWWLVIPDASIVKKGELPAGWGLLVASNGKLRARVRAPRLDPEPLPLDMTICLMSAAQKTAHHEHLHRDAPNAFVGTWDPKCGFCGVPAPCPAHQPRALAGGRTDA
ncbi:hypothetical protein [Gryllotalpicola koreensis]|uniref:hypothetical protein n=1 Tax=Gryllotalpicola koreensis TaxID=993086 RepID=UPI0031DEA174